ncbi:Adenosylcobinamide kinase / Adenosylcobinamide-phosphate guanylyltransferase [hydrothermal vent metagenome]|uniref:Adenosylcobinamide kinase n=1 Tax=hydrothermal vent metagenome TaxID=652676 RepID=A0A3B0S8M5_9ZZZZ
MVLGGARSGKSTVACRLAQQSGSDVTFIATARPLDDEMRARIAAHVDDRPTSWVTIEAPLALSEAVAGVDTAHTIIIDCVTVWISNLVVETGLSHNEVLERVDDLIEACLLRDAMTVVVSNEVGMGVVPDTELGRSFRDLQGFVNSRLAVSAQRAGLVVAGRILDLGTQETWVAS